MHEETCSDRLLVEMFMTTKNVEEEKNVQQDSRARSSRQESTHASEDDWDCSVPTKSYNPKIKCRNNNILIHVQHGTPSMRKYQREQNHERLNNIKDSIN